MFVLFQRFTQEHSRTVKVSAVWLDRDNIVVMIKEVVV